MKKILAVAAATIFLTACVNSYQQNYRPFINTQAAPNLELLAEGATPLIIKSDDIKKDIANAKAEGYIVIGESSFNGELQSQRNLMKQAKEVRATLVFYSANYTDTETVTTTSYVPSDTTTYSSGRYGRKSYEETTTTSV